MAGHSAGFPPSRCPPPQKQRQQRRRAQQRARRHRHQIGRQNLRLRHMWRLRQVIDLWLIHQQEEGVEVADACRARPRRRDRRRSRHAHAARRPAPARAVCSSLDLAELDALRRTGLGAGGRQAVLLPVVAERTLPGAPVGVVQLDHAEGAGDLAVAAAVADVGLDVDIAELVADDRAGRAGIRGSPAFVQCLQTSLIISQRESPSRPSFAPIRCHTPGDSLAARTAVHALQPHELALCPCRTAR